MPTRRARRTPQEARQVILNAAASLLAEGGVAAVQVRAVAARVGMTDAGITHHFGNRENLLHELLGHGGRQLRAAVYDVLNSWLEHGAEPRELVELLAATYRHGYSELAVALHTAGWRDQRSGMLEPVVQALHDLRPESHNASLDDTRLLVAALHQAVAMEPMYGPAFRQSAGFTATDAGDPTAQLQWWTNQLTTTLGLDPPTRTTGPT